MYLSCGRPILLLDEVFLLNYISVSWNWNLLYSRICWKNSWSCYQPSPCLSTPTSSVASSTSHLENFSFLAYHRCQCRGGGLLAEAGLQAVFSKEGFKGLLKIWNALVYHMDVWEIEDSPELTWVLKSTLLYF